MIDHDGAGTAACFRHQDIGFGPKRGMDLDLIHLDKLGPGLLGHFHCGDVLRQRAEGGGEATAEVVLRDGTTPVAGAPKFVFTASATARVVLRDEFLDGTFFRGSDRVPRRALVPTMMAVSAASVTLSTM